LWLGRLFAPLSNWALEIPGSRWVLERTLGIAAERDLPRFQRETFRDWMAERGGSRVPESEANRRVLLPADPYMNFTNPAVGQAAVRVLEAADVHVTVPETVTDSGRPAFSKGLLERARRTAAENVDTLVPAIEDGWELVTVEPSEAVMYQHDYLSLLSGESVNHLAANSYGLFEYLHSKDLIGNIGADPNPSEVAYHGHCHQQAHRKDHHAVAVLRQAGFSVDVLDSTCCGMAGSFGYEAEHHSMSMAIGSLLFEQVTQSSADTVVAPGASCRTQLGARPESDEPPHPVELLAGAL
jgi:Fe-S oxidoreductase